jgi:hypothetical protein
VITTCSRGVLAALLAIACLGKLLGGYQEYFAIPESMFLASIGFEACLLIGLLTKRHWRLSALGVGLLSAIGIGIELLGSGATCGCLGSLVRLSAGQHVLVNATAGAIACMIVMFKESEGNRGLDLGRTETGPDSQHGLASAPRSGLLGDGHLAPDVAQSLAPDRAIEHETRLYE